MKHTTQINIIWQADDILMVDKNLSKQQVGEALDLLKKNHDATLGITWETVRCTVALVKRNHNKGN